MTYFAVATDKYIWDNKYALYHSREKGEESGNNFWKIQGWEINK